MRTNVPRLTGVLYILAAFSTSVGQIARNDAQAGGPTTSAYVVSDRGPHHRVWSQVTWETNRFGKVMARTNSYTELETGMHYLRDGQWVESSSEIKIALEGAEATNGPHRVKFAANLNSTNAVDFTTPDGKRLRSRILGLGYYDEESRKFVLFAQLQDSIGEIHTPDRAVYLDAFDALEVDVEYLNSKAKFEQNLILRAQPPAPSKWNLNPETTHLQVLTEFFDPPVPEKLHTAPASSDEDEILSFGEMSMRRGEGFLVDDGSGAKQAIAVSKRWVTSTEGRTFLVEEVKFNPLNQRIQSLPVSQRTAQIIPGQIGHGETLLAALQQVLPKATSNPKRGVMRLAKSDVGPRPGFVLDYSILSGASDFTFKADTTYYCTNTVNLTGTTTIEGGSVIKYSVDSTAQINIHDTLTCLTGAYRLAVFTAKDDNTIGEPIYESTGNPSTYYGNGLRVYPAETPINHIRFAYIRTVYEPGDKDMTSVFRNCQFMNCGTVFKNRGVCSVRFYNVLCCNIDTIFDLGSNDAQVEHLTAEQCNNLSLTAYDGIVLTSSLLVGVTNFNGAFITTNQSVFLEDGGSAFQTVGAGAHYLADGSLYRNAGTTNINAELLADLRSKTTYPPIVFSNQTVSADMVLSPQAQRDTDAPDLGYHYDPLDYAFGASRLTNCTVTLQPGTAIGAFCGNNTYSLCLWPGAKLHSEGTPTAPNWIARYNTVQEQANLNWTNAVSSDYTILGNWLGGVAAELTCRFTKFSSMANRTAHYGDIYPATSSWFRDCEFHGGSFRIKAQHITATNCLFNRVYSILSDENALNDVGVWNCLFYGGNLEVLHFDGGDYVFRDNLFDLTTMYQDGGVNTDYNGYRTGTTTLTSVGAHDVVTNVTYVAGPLGYFYQPTNSPFINWDNSTTANNVGLYHYTVTTNLVSGLQIQETNSFVDIGYHYVALNSSNQPIDSDGEGFSDYQEDGNGNGSVDSGETRWDDGNDWGLKVIILRPGNTANLLP